MPDSHREEEILMAELNIVQRYLMLVVGLGYLILGALYMYGGILKTFDLEELNGLVMILFAIISLFMEIWILHRERERDEDLD